jgi:hypothetical protein
MPHNVHFKRFVDSHQYYPAQSILKSNVKIIALLMVVLARRMNRARYMYSAAVMNLLDSVQSITFLENAG